MGKTHMETYKSLSQFFINLIFHSHPHCTRCQNRRPAKCTMYNTMCSGQTPSLNLTSRTCSKNHINWYKPCRVLHLQALHVDEEEHLEQAEKMSSMEWWSLNDRYIIKRRVTKHLFIQHSKKMATIGFGNGVNVVCLLKTGVFLKILTNFLINWYISTSDRWDG